MNRTRARRTSTSNGPVTCSDAVSGVARIGAGGLLPYHQHVADVPAPRRTQSRCEAVFPWNIPKQEGWPEVRQQYMTKTKAQRARARAVEAASASAADMPTTVARETRKHLERAALTIEEIDETLAGSR
jgi:hypothetical protein